MILQADALTLPLNWPSDFINKIICGDCLEVMKEMPDKCVDLILTDPPYNVQKDYGEYKDNLKKKEYLLLIEKITKELQRISGNKMVIVLGSKSDILRGWWNNIPDAKLIIVKMGATSNNKIKNLGLQYHAVLTTIKSNKWMPDLWEDIRWPGEGYFFNEPRYGHPAMTPLKLAKRCIILFSHEKSIIFDPFMGSGTVARASKDLKSNFIGIEINPGYCKIAEERLAQGVLP